MLSGPFIQLELLSFEQIAFAHTLSASNYHYRLENHGYGIYGDTPENGGILEIGFVEQNPLELTCELGSFLAEENSIFIIPPQCSFSVQAKSPELHRHTSVECLIRCRTQQVQALSPTDGRTIVLPIVIPPAQENRQLLNQIRSIACLKTAGPQRSYFEECANFMQLLQSLNLLLRDSRDMDPISPGNRRHCDRAKTFIAQNISRPLKVSDVANAIGVSKNYLTNVFSSSEGVPLIEYINRRKLSHMVDLIRRYDYTLSEAGAQVGYTDVNYVSRIFKRYYGMTVTQYKQELKHR